MTPTRALGRTEFIALMAMLAATVAFSIDAMLPALPEIAAEVTPDAPNRAQLILTSFMLGLGIGTFFTGSLSDAIGRKPVMVAGAAIYILGAALSWAAPTLELLLSGRALQGLGAAGPRVVALAMTRDLYSGRGMAKIISFVMTVFALVPAIAPTIGAGIIALTGWRGIFAAFVLFSALTTLWLMLRQPETHPPEARRPLSIAFLREALREIFGRRLVVLAIAAQTLTFACLVATLSSAQAIFEQTYGRGETFHLWFGLIALLSAGGSILNSQIVERFGMKRLAATAFAAQSVISGLAALLILSGGLGFALLIVWITGIFFMIGLTIGNLNAIAMEPLGRLAGFAASAMSAISTVASLPLAIPVGLAFDGTPLPLALGLCAFTGVAALIVRAIPQPSA